MTVQIKTKFLFNSGPIRFKDLRSNFKGTSEGQITASSLYRETASGVTDPIVPDSSINDNIPAIDSGTSLNLSNFRGSVKEIILRQSGTDKNLYGDSVDGWGGDLDRNIKKTLEIAGIVGSEESNTASFNWSGDARNVQVQVNGVIDGASGIAGTVDDPDGGDGGDAININPNHKIRFLVKPSGKIRSGGGGGAGGASGADGEDGADGADGSDGAQGPQGAGGNGGSSGGEGGAGGDGGQFGAGGEGGDGYNPGAGTAGRGGAGGRGGDGGQGGPGGKGGDRGADGADGGKGADGSDGKCKGITDQKYLQSGCGSNGAPDCPSNWKNGPSGNANSCWGWWPIGPNYTRFRYCYKWSTQNVSGGIGGNGGKGGLGGQGGDGGRGGDGGYGGYGGRGGSGGNGGVGGKGGNGKGFGYTNNSAQLGKSASKGQAGQAGGNAGTGKDGSWGKWGGWGQWGQWGENGQAAQSCPSGWDAVKYAQAGLQGETGKAGEQGKAGENGGRGQDGQSGEAGQDGQDGNPGQDGGMGGDYGQNGSSTPFGQGGIKGKAIVNTGGSYHVILEPGESSYPSGGMVLGEYNQSTTDVQSAAPTTFVFPVKPDATMTSSGDTLSEGQTMTFNVSTQNIQNGTYMYYTLFGFGVKEVDFVYNSEFDTSLAGSFIINSNSGSFSITAAQDNLVEEDIEVLVAIRIESPEGEIMDHKFITLTKNNT